MKKDLWILTVVLSSVLLLMPGCVSKQEYDTAISDLEKTQQELQTTQAELTAMTAKSENATAELQSSKAELQTLQNTLIKAGTTASTLNPKLDLMRKYLLAESHFYLAQQAALQNETEDAEQQLELALAVFKTIDASVESIEDHELSRAWGEAWPANFRAQSETMQMLIIAPSGMSEFLERLETLIKTDSDALSVIAAEEPKTSYY